jgi:hypothetical protein
MQNNIQNLSLFPNQLIGIITTSNTICAVCTLLMNYDQVNWNLINIFQHVFETNMNHKIKRNTKWSLFWKRLIWFWLIIASLLGQVQILTQIYEWIDCNYIVKLKVRLYSNTKVKLFTIEKSYVYINWLTL